MWGSCIFFDRNDVTAYVTRLVSVITLHVYLAQPALSFLSIHVVIVIGLYNSLNILSLCYTLI